MVILSETPHRVFRSLCADQALVPLLCVIVVLCVTSPQQDSCAGVYNIIFIRSLGLTGEVTYDRTVKSSQVTVSPIYATVQPSHLRSSFYVAAQLVLTFTHSKCGPELLHEWSSFMLYDIALYVHLFTWQNISGIHRLYNGEGILAVSTILSFWALPVIWMIKVVLQFWTSNFNAF